MDPRGGPPRRVHLLGALETFRCPCLTDSSVEVYRENAAVCRVLRSSILQWLDILPQEGEALVLGACFDGGGESPLLSNDMPAVYVNVVAPKVFQVCCRTEVAGKNAIK